MLYLLSYAVYGLIIGIFARLLCPGENKMSILATMLIGIAGSYAGGLINYFIGKTTEPFSPSGIVMGVVGGVICCWIYSNYHLNQYLKLQKKELLKLQNKLKEKNEF